MRSAWFCIVTCYTIVIMYYRMDTRYLIRVYGDTKEARVSVDELILVPNNRVPKDACIVQIRQTGHIITTVKLWRVHLSNLIFLENFLLK